jgi:hypothetical protein
VDAFGKKGIFFGQSKPELSTSRTALTDKFRHCQQSQPSDEALSTLGHLHVDPLETIF